MTSFGKMLGPRVDPAMRAQTGAAATPQEMQAFTRGPDVGVDRGSMLPPETVAGRAGVSQPTSPEEQMAHIQMLIQKAQSGQQLAPEEIAMIRQFLGDAPTEDSEGYWDGGANGKGMTGVNMPDETYGGDPSFNPLGMAPGGGEAPPAQGGGVSQRMGTGPLHKMLRR